MNKRLRTLSIIIVLLTVCSTAFAGERRIYVGGKKIDIHKSGRIYTDAIKSGTVTFDAEEDEDGYRRLILDNAVIETTGKDKSGINSSIKNLKIVVNGTCRITTAKANGIKIDGAGSVGFQDANAHIVGNGTLNVIASGGSAVYLTSCNVDNGTDGEYIIIIGSDDGHSYCRSGRLIIEDGVTVNLTSTTEDALDGKGKHCVVSVKDDGKLICEGKKHAINGIKWSFNVSTQNSVFLVGNGNYSTVEETEVELDESMEFDNPDLWYGENHKTVFQGNSTAAYKGDIVIRKGLAITETTFPDENFRNYVLGLNAGKDGYLVRSEIAGITSMDVKNMGIKDLTGIMHFTALRNLVCFLNDLTSLDVSRNTNLEYLDCSANKLTKLVVSRTINPNTNLKEVRCYCNQLDAKATGSMVYGLPSVSNGKLLILADNGDDGNVITPAKVTEAKNKGWTVQKQNSSNQEVAYTGTTGVEINETNFPDENFRTFLRDQDYGKDSYLTPAELQAVTEMEAEEKDISNLKGIEHFTALETLYCYGNKLSSLDVSKLTALKILGCTRNKLTSLDVSKLTALEWLNIIGNQIKGTNMTTLVNSLPNNSGRFLVCGDMYDTDNEITNAQVTIARNKGWKVLRIVQNSGYEGYVDYDGNIDINEENFPDPFFRTYLKKQDYGSDGSLSPAEIKSVTEINVASNGMDDLKGVEFFTSLKKLYCQDNFLTSLDVSKLTELEELKCYLNQLDKIDVSKNTKLTLLNVRDNGMKELDVSKNTKLTLLNCRSNELTKLDVSKNTALSTLHCYNNQISGDNMTALVNSLPKISGNIYVCCDALTPDNYITTAQVKIATNKGWKVWKYTDKDVSQRVSYAGDQGIEINTTNFPDKNFRTIVSASDIDKNQNNYLTRDELEAVTELKLLDGKSVDNLKGIEYFTELTVLECGHTYSLTSLDVSKNTKLTSLRLEQASITSLDLSNNTELTTLNCSNNDLASLDVSNCKMLTSLDCSGNEIRGDAMTVLVNSLPEANGTLYVRDYRFNSSNDNGISPSQVMVAKNKGWAVKIFQSGVWYDYYGVPDVAINEENFPDEKFRDVVAGPTINTNGDEGLSYEELQAVTSLDVTGKGISDLKGIEHFTALKELYCGYNNLTDLSFYDLGKLTELTTLDCSYNQIKSLYILDKNTKLENLFCIDNNMEELVLRQCPLTYLDCSYNKLHKLELVSIGGLLKAFYCNANELTTLDVSGYKVLKFFDCAGNKINGDNMEALVNSLPTVDYGIFWACNESRFPDNVITAAQVNIATDKGWEVMSICSTEKDGYAGQGDINGDKKIDLADLEMLEDIIMGRAENIDEYTGDVNKDGKTDAADIVTLVNILNGK